MKDPHGNLRSTAERAQIFTEHYQDAQWNKEDLDPLPERPPIHGPAPFGEGDFTPTEIRCRRRKPKKKRTSGPDDIKNELVAKRGLISGRILVTKEHT